jgi:hypothetical protein
MPDETPEQIRERVLAEELAKGSDPRVAEGRAKAAEVRAQHGLPIDPDQAWRALLEREGGTPAASTAVATEPAAPPEEVAAPEPAEAPPAEGAPAPPEETAAPEPAEAPPTEGAPAPEEAAAAPEPAPALETVTPAEPSPPKEPDHEPEIGEFIDLDAEAFETVAGIKVRESRLPAGLLLILVMIPLWAIFYLAAFAGSDSIARTSGCLVNWDHTLVCFQEGTGGAPSGGE